MKLFVLVALVTVGCGGTEDISTTDVAAAYGAALSVDAAQLEAGMMGAIATQLGSASYATGEQQADAAADATAQFMPPGCAASIVQARFVTYTFKDCTGPYGLAKLNGTLTAAFTPTTIGLSVGLLSTGLELNTVRVDLAANTLLAPSGSRASATVESTTRAENARGETAKHQGSYTASWDADCLSLDGSFMTTLGALSWSTVISGYRVCRGMCPDSTGKVVVSGQRGASVTVYYSAGGTAEVLTDSRTRGMIVLACGAA